MCDLDLESFAEIAQRSEFKTLQLPVIGGKDCESVSRTPKHEETFRIGQKISVKALHTPCHTQDSICWLMEDGDEKVPGHEYTKQNVKFLVTVLQTEPVKKLQSFAENNEQTQGKFTIGDEKEYNVFMRVDDPTIQKATGKTDPVEVMAKLREMKNNM
ncbi:MAG: hypothetical protein Q9197_005333 [Variospora fuerteventurae]